MSTGERVVKAAMVTKDQKRYHDALCRIVGCIACRKHGRENHHVSIHHTDGRTKPDAHWKVLPLCGIHHQLGIPDEPSVHPDKARFERLYGKQAELMAECRAILSANGYKGVME